jgi:dUTP pyrophosphatase
MSTTVNFKKLKENAIIPTRGSEYAAGYDLYAIIGDNIFDEKSLEIPPHSTVKVDTGLAMELPNGTFGAIFARSGLATKKGLRPANSVGVIDSDYRGSIIVALHNDTDETQTIINGERIAQLIILPYIQVDFKEVEELSDTKRGSGGFGSTGKK